jgi:hypothetical protein
MRFIVAVDLGTMQDYTAIAILEEMSRSSFKQTAKDVARGDDGEKIIERFYALRHLDRLQQRISYTEIAKTIVGLMGSPALAGQAELVVDATGVGRPMVDMLRESRLEPTAITITNGKSVTNEGQEYHVPKRDLATALQVAFASKRLVIAQGLPLVPAFLREVEAFKVKITTSGNDTYEAWREKDHDDLVLSVAMGIWWAFFTRNPEVKQRSRLDKREQYDPLRYGL